MSLQYVEQNNRLFPFPVNDDVINANTRKDFLQRSSSWFLPPFKSSNCIIVLKHNFWWILAPSRQVQTRSLSAGVILPSPLHFGRFIHHQKCIFILIRYLLVVSMFELLDSFPSLFCLISEIWIYRGLCLSIIHMSMILYNKKQ